MLLEILVVYSVPQRRMMPRWLFRKPLKLQGTELFFYMCYVYDHPESKDALLRFFEDIATHSIK